MSANIREEERDEGADMMYARRYFDECRCAGAAHGGCRCEDDGDVSHGGAERERQDHQSGLGGRQRTRR